MPQATFTAKGLDETTWVEFAALSSDSVLRGRLIDGVAASIDDAALREAQQAVPIRAYELVYAALGASRHPGSISVAE